MISPKEQVSTEFTKKQLVVHAKAQAAIKTEKRKRQDIDFRNNMSDKEYILHLELEATRLVTKIDWLDPNHNRRMLRFLSLQRDWIIEKMEQHKLALSSSSLVTTLGGSTHGGSMIDDDVTATRAAGGIKGDSEPYLPEDLATHQSVMHAKTQAAIKTKETVQSTKEGKKRKWQHIEDLKGKEEAEYIQNLEVEAEKLSGEYLRLRNALFKEEMEMMADFINQIKKKMVSRQKQLDLLEEEDDDDDDLFEEDIFGEENDYDE